MVNRVHAGAAHLQKREVQESEVVILGETSCQDTDQILVQAMQDTDQLRCGNSRRSNVGHRVACLQLEFAAS